MKALTIRQPWASLIAEGVKTIETRSWPTKYRGQVAIHAGAADLDRDSTGAVLHGLAMAEGGPMFLSWPDRWWEAHTWVCRKGHVSDRVLKTDQGDRCLECRRPMLGLVPPEWDDLPRAAVVAVATLADCVPMRNTGETSVPGTELVLNLQHEGDLRHQQGGMWIFGPTVSSHRLPRRVEGQRPFGDFAPGRWAWLLEDVEPIDPMPAKGRLGLWDWEPA